MNGKLKRPKRPPEWKTSRFLGRRLPYSQRLLWLACVLALSGIVFGLAALDTLRNSFDISWPPSNDADVVTSGIEEVLSPQKAATSRIVASRSAAMRWEGPYELNLDIQMPSLVTFDLKSEPEEEVEPSQDLLLAESEPLQTSVQQSLSFRQSLDSHNMRREAPPQRAHDTRRTEAGDGLGTGSMSFSQNDLDPALPQPLPTLSSPQVRMGMRTVSGLIRNCSTGSYQSVLVDVTIDGNTGRITESNIEGPLAETEVGMCITRALRRARFPRFLAKNIKIEAFPFILSVAE